MASTETKEEHDIVEKSVDALTLMLYNDDVNTFDHVIDTLIELCNHTVEQAEQCAMIVHYNGKCDVDHGTYEDLSDKCATMLRKGLTAKII